MKISRLNQSVNVNFDNKITKNKTVKSPITQGMVELANNSLAEVIGRSQVSFKGESRLSGNILEYQNVSKLTGKSESFIYNKEDGSIEHEEYTSGNVLKKKYKFNPTTGFEQITLLQNDGTTTVETKEPDLYKFEKFDEDGNPLYREEADDDSEESKLNRVTVTYEYGDKAREIIRRYKNGSVSEVEVVDPRTGDVVTEGRLLESKFRRKDGWILTKNIVNGDVYEKELKDQYGSRLQYQEYSRKTLALVHEFRTDNKTGETFETKYTDDGKNVLFVENKSYSGNVLYKATYSPKTLQMVSEETFDSSTGNRTIKEFSEDGIIVKQTINQKDGTTETSDYYENGKIKKCVVTSKNKREVDEYEYAKNGEMVSDIHFEFNRKGALQEKTVYVPNTGIVKTRTDYKNESTYTTYEYNTASSDEKINVPISSNTYEYGVLVSEQHYHKDGETISEQIVYGEDRFFEYSKYDRNGDILEKTYCTDKAVPYEYEKYNEFGIVVKRVKDINSMNLRETTLYNENTGNQTKFIRRTKDGKPLLQIEYYPNGKSERIVREYKSDGSYTKTEYDEYGNVISRSNHEGKAQTIHSSQQVQPEENQGTKTTEELIESLAKKMGKPWVDVLPSDPVQANWYFSKSKITSDEMKAILDVTGIESPEQLFTINKKQYRTISKNFHPNHMSLQERDSNPERAKFEEEVFRIISNIYSNSPNEGV